MPEIPNVLPSTPVAVEWGNKIRDRTVQRYTGASQRSSLHASPSAGDLSYLADTGAFEIYHSGAWRSLVPTGVVLPWAGGAAPPGYLVANGALVSRTTYAALFAAIGTTFGAGDGSTTFALPDLRQRFPLGLAASGVGSAMGQTGGSIDHVHTGPSHQHGLVPHDHVLGTSNSSGNAPTTSAGGHTHTIPDTSSGGSHSHSFSDTTGGASSSDLMSSGANSVARSSHTHSVSGTTSSGGSHAHTIGDTGSSGSHAHTAPSHQHGLGTSEPTPAGELTGSAGTANTGTANPPFLVLNFIIRT